MRPAPSGKVIANIQALRALAALMVVFVHCELAAHALHVSPSLRTAFSSGVELFFVISGYVMVRTTAERPPGAARFLLNRFARVAPIYWLLTLAAFAVALLLPAAVQGTTPTIEYLAKSLSFIPYERPDGHVRPILFVGWSLNYEMMFYVIFAAGLLARSRVTGLMAAIAVIMALALFGLLARPSDPVLRFVSAPIILHFVAGMLLGDQAHRLRTNSRLVIVLALVAIPASAALLVAGPLFLGIGIISTLVAATMLVAMAVLLEQSGVAITARLPVLLGDASYSLYLTHPFVAVGLGFAVNAMFPIGPAGAVALLVITYVAVCSVAVLFYRLVELPLTRLARQALNVRPPAVPVRGL